MMSKKTFIIRNWKKRFKIRENQNWQIRFLNTEEILGFPLLQNFPEIFFISYVVKSFTIICKFHHTKEFPKLVGLRSVWTWNAAAHVSTTCFSYSTTNKMSTSIARCMAKAGFVRLSKCKNIVQPELRPYA